MLVYPFVTFAIAEFPKWGLFFVSYFQSFVCCTTFNILSGYCTWTSYENIMEMAMHVQAVDTRPFLSSKEWNTCLDVCTSLGIPENSMSSCDLYNVYAETKHKHKRLSEVHALECGLRYWKTQRPPSSHGDQLTNLATKSNLFLRFLPSFLFLSYRK